ncbi:MAG: PA14 domain-containing protein, partial [Pirellulales bacterium]
INGGRPAARKTACANNLHQIGIALAAASEEKIDSANWRTALEPYLDRNTTVHYCPEFPDGSAGYGMNNKYHLLLGADDANKIVMLDYNAPVASISLTPSLDRCDEWDANAAFRHMGTLNVLYYDGHVASIGPDEADPCKGEIIDSSGNTASIQGIPTYGPGDPEYNQQEYPYPFYWVPSRIPPYDSESGDGCLMGTYYTGMQFNGTSATRCDDTLHLPYGTHASNFFGGKPYTTPLPGTPPPPFGSAVWEGQIKADHNEPYDFWVACDNVVRLYVDGQLLMNRENHNTGGVTTFHKTTSSVNLYAGQWVDLRVENREVVLGSPSHIWVKWSSPSTPIGEIPAANLRSN